MTKDELLRLIPDFLRDIREFNEIFSAVASEAEKFDKKAVRQETDFYIYSEDISPAGADRLAQSMKIDVSGLTLEDKVFKIKSVLLDKRPYNIPNVKNMLSVLCGEDGYSFISDNENLSVTVKIDLGRKSQFSAVYELLDKVIPSNMLLNVSLLYNLYGDITGKTYGEMSSMTHEQLRSDVL